jgi:hypothetical protein
MKEVIPLKDLVDAEDRSKENSILSHCIMHTLGRFDEKNKAIMEEIQRDKEVTVELKLNGRPVSLKSFLMEFERQHERMLAAVAKEAVEKRLGDVMDKIYDVERFVKDKFREAFNQDDD